jgi:membrane protein DedA with SNARE-associated domain
MLEWITGIITQLGLAGIGFLMFAENIFPPIPSELIMPLAGYVSSQGHYTLANVIAVGVLGTLLGAIPWYYAGKLLDTERLQRWAERWGKYCGIRPQDFAKADAWFDRHGKWIILVGRLIPGVRTLISVPAGSCGMPLGTFFLYSAIGSTLWCAGLAIAGYQMGEHYTVIEHYIAPLSKIALGTVTLAVLGFIGWRWRHKKALTNG